MLVLTRKAEQSILIGDEIRVSVVEIRGNRVKLAVDAPRAVPIRRFELQLDDDRLRDRNGELLGSGI